MKTIISAAVCLMSLGLCAFGDEPPYQFQYTVTYKDGSKSEGSALFLPEDSIEIPIHMDTLGHCVLSFNPDRPNQSTEKSKQNIGRFSIIPISKGESEKVTTIFGARLQFTPGQEIALLRAMDVSVSVTIKASEEKK